MGRELASFTDLQKTLGQLGFNSGTALLRLSFQASETPLEEAMEQIEQYFTSIEGGDQAVEGSASSTVDGFSAPNPTPSQDVPKAETETETSTRLSLQENPIDEQVTTPENQTSDPPPAAETTIPGPDQRVISVFAPPSSTAPYASRQAFNEEDYEPTVDHARLHQARLAQSSRNKRLPTDAEIAAQEETQRQKIANVKEVEIKIRFPDQTQVISKFSDADTGSGLYTFVKGLMEKENEPFILNFTAARGPRTVPNDPEIKLITGLAMTGKVLVNFLWHEGASVEARGGPVLKETFQSKAQEIQIPKMRETEAEKDSGPGLGVGQEPTRQGGGGEGKGKGKVPKWLKLPGKK
jgi:tether containing UBX domain for GLUT4